jgi:hypothetical protein
VPKAWKTFERPQFEDFIQEERAWSAAWCACGVEERKRRVERRTRGRWHAIGNVRLERRRRGDGAEKSFRCGGAAFHVDVLRRAAPDCFTNLMQ